MGLHKFGRTVARMMLLTALLSAGLFFHAPIIAADTAAAQGWLHWRGPQQTGASTERGLPEKWELGGTDDLWQVELNGRGTPVVVGDRLYAWGYRGEGRELQEVLACLDAASGKTIWEHSYSDFLSDIIYDRYAIGAPTVDPETGNVYLMTSPGLLMAHNADGKLLWQHSMGETFGRLTFPNGRTGAPVVDGDLVIMHLIVANWGNLGPTRDRFYAFDKNTGDLVWVSTPGVGPPFLKDSSFSTPVFETRPDGTRVFYSGTGCGNVVCVNAKTGEPIWRYQLSVGGINSSVLLHDGKVIAIHGVENIDSSETGRMIALRTDVKPVKGKDGTMVLPKEAEIWRNDLCMFSSSPVLVGDRIYQVDQTGELHSVDANTGKILWSKKLGPDQIHASPAYADGKLYVPMNNGTFYILKPTDEGAEELSKTKLAGNGLGAPSIYNGRVYVFTTDRLYAFGSKDGNDPAKLPAAPAPAVKPQPREPVALQVVPAEVLLNPGEQKQVVVRAVDDRGYAFGPVKNATFQKYVPATAKTPSEMDATFNRDGVLAAESDAQPSAGAFKVTAGTLSGTTRGRVLPKVPFSENFDNVDLNEKAPDGTAFAHPPLPWIGARAKWVVQNLDGSNVLAKTLNSLILMRAITFIGSADLSDYTVQADVMTDGNRRLLSEVGLINQRYIVCLKGNHDQLEVSSNHERLKVAVPFPIKAKTWYTLKTRVDTNADGSGVVRAKAWERGSDEPAEWTIEVPVEHVHQNGAPGLFGFATSNRFAVYVDNIAVTANK